MYHGFGSESLNFLDSFGSALLEGYAVNLQKDQTINSFLLCFVPSVGRWREWRGGWKLHACGDEWCILS